MPSPARTSEQGIFVRFSVPGATLPGQDTPVPDLLVKSYWESFSVKMQEKITRKKTKGGWVEEHWPGDLDTVSVSGATGAFILVNDPTTAAFSDRMERASLGADLRSGDVSTSELTVSPQNSSLRGPDFGLATGNQVFLRRLSEASLNLEALADFYRTNGATFTDEGRVAKLRDIEMNYMGDLYVGYFTEFQHTHSDKSPNMFTYSFTFRVKETYFLEVTPIAINAGA